MERMIFAQHIGKYLNDFCTTQQANLDNLRLQVVDDSLNLLTHHRGWQVVELLDTKCILHRNRSDCRCCNATQLVNDTDIRLNA